MNLGREPDSTYELPRDQTCNEVTYSAGKILNAL